MYGDDHSNGIDNRPSVAHAVCPSIYLTDYYGLPLKASLCLTVIARTTHHYILVEIIILNLTIMICPS